MINQVCNQFNIHKHSIRGRAVFDIICCKGSLPDALNVVVSCMAQHYNDVIMSAMASQITSLKIVYSTVCSGTDQRKHQSSASLAFVRGIHRSPVKSQHKRPVTQKKFPFDYVIIVSCGIVCNGIAFGEQGGKHALRLPIWLAVPGYCLIKWVIAVSDVNQGTSYCHNFVYYEITNWIIK